jgi:hypothetical protein
MMVLMKLAYHLMKVSYYFVTHIKINLGNYLWLTTKERNPRANYIFNYSRINAYAWLYARSETNGITVNAKIIQARTTLPIKRLFFAWIAGYTKCTYY